MSCEVFEAAPNPDGNIGDFPSEVMLDAVETICRTTVYITDEFTSVVSAYLLIVPAATGNLRWSCTTDFGRICVSEDYNTHSDSVAETTTAVTADEIECLDVSGALTGLAAEDLVGVTFIRHGDDVLDTIGDSVHFLGVLITICS